MAFGLTHFLVCGHSEVFPPPDGGGEEAKRMRQCSADIQNGWSYSTTPPVCLDGLHRNEGEYLPSLFLSEWFD